MTTDRSLSDLLADLVPAHIAALPIYQPGKPLSEVERELGITGAIKLASNENPLGPSPRAIEAMTASLPHMAEYPDGGGFHLRNALAERLGIEKSEIIFGAGSNEIIFMAVRALCHPGADEILSHEAAFISYRIAAVGHGVKFVTVKPRPDLGPDVDALLAAATERTRIVFVASPNNPTGAHLVPDDLARLVDELPPTALLVLDEAYFEYATRAGVPYQSAIELRERRPMMLTLRTFSKAYGLAGVRLGYGVGPTELLNILTRLRRPFNANAVAQAGALAALDDEAHVDASAALAREGIEILSAAARELGLTAYPSLGNFVLIDVGRDCVEVYEKMLKRGVIVRPMGPWGLPTCLRISAGTREQNERAARTLREVLG